jgi:hypothetical protein
VSRKPVEPDQVAAAMHSIESSTDAEALKRLMENAQAMGVTAVYDAAFAKRLSLLSQEAPGTVAHDGQFRQRMLDQNVETVLRHKQHFSEVVVDAARARLEKVGVDVGTLPKT